MANIADRPWTTGIWRQVPWTGLLSLLIGLLCGIAAILVAYDFDDQPLDHWKINGVVVQATVLLFIFAKVSKASFSHAFTTGIAIFW